MNLSPYKITSNNIYLVQTDTTVGFASKSAKGLVEAKGRPNDKPFLRVSSTFKVLPRVRSEHKKRVRRSKKSTFIYTTNQAYRIIKEGKHQKFLQDIDWIYSTSANESSKGYERGFARTHCDIIVEDSRGLFEGEASALYDIRKKKIQRLR